MGALEDELGMAFGMGEEEGAETALEPDTDIPLSGDESLLEDLADDLLTAFESKDKSSLVSALKAFITEASMLEADLDASLDE